ncbi:phospholipid-binding lipoprotein MlaA [Paraburkholderia eburnea]|uniref:Phospholipid-binding lipoprotein MlaA n=1 Tax=Paraburkholderia eburnea TaxID=1189126 RepID=A0A2S4LXQ0_9BURK|nr:VacJ family lipoprotein [Paraburkholderia eburnea]POR47234.1 phospholipid-binding lipoprotein MlaA [Paraburkholderia eburnea]PRZ18611.1 phospholipid-binding lipoprotein MlaA [Paraburkholderia eburnea]
MITTRMRAITIGVAALALTACSTVQTPSKDDPWEGFNRTVYTFNDKVDQYALKPVAKGYVKITPQPVRDSVTNFFANIGDVYNAANNFLQLKITDGVEDIMRIVINTVFGVGGLFDVATLAKLPKHNQDFGLTLGHYGVPAGPYLVLPLFGPSTVRDGVGLVGNYFINPVSYIDPAAVSWGLYGLNVVSTRANLLGASDLLEGAAIDKYSFVRNTYLQRRRYQLSDGHVPDYGDGAPPPNYGEPDEGAAGAAAAMPASGTARAATPNAASMAPAYPNGAPTAPATLEGPAGVTAPASGAEAPNGASATNVPGDQMVPPARIGYPGMLRLH